MTDPVTEWFHRHTLRLSSAQEEILSGYRAKVATMEKAIKQEAHGSSAYTKLALDIYNATDEMIVALYAWEKQEKGNARF